MSEKPLTIKQLAAAVMVAEASMTRARIAEEVGIAESLLYKWLKLPAFRLAVAEKVKELEEAVSGLYFANKRGRLAALNDQAQDIDRIRRERAERALNAPRSVLGKTPGAKTGRMVHTKKVIGTGRSQHVIDEITYDRALDAQFQSTLEQIAKERGELTEKRELTGPHGMPLIAIREIVVRVPSDYQDDGDE